MEEYMFIFAGGEDQALELSPEGLQAYMGEWFAWVAEVQKQGCYVGGHPLKPEGKGVYGKDKIVTDGPFAELKELIGGYMIIKASDIDQAVEMAKGCPVFQFDGRVEVRPILPLEEEG